MQYWRLLGLPGLKPVSRFQLVLAILMFAGSPAWLATVMLASLRPLLVPAVGPAFRPEAGALLLAIILAMVFAPKIASIVAVLASRRRRNEFGPPSRFLAGVGIEVVFSMVLAPIMAVAHSVFIAGLVAGRTIGWSSQVRDGHSVPLPVAAGALWRQTLVGAGLAAWFAWTTPGIALLFVPFWGPLLLSAPFATFTAWPALGVAMTRARIAAVPEELAPPPDLLRLSLPALSPGAPARGEIARQTPP